MAVYVTLNMFVFSPITRLNTDVVKVAIMCETEEEAIDVAQDACSIISYNNVRLRKCGTPHNRVIITSKEYWEKHSNK